MLICRALLKNGYANFSLNILEFCKGSDLPIREKYYIDLLSPDYNIAQDTLAPMTGRKHSDEARKKISFAFKGKRIGENNNMYGRKHSDEARKKMIGG